MQDHLQITPSLPKQPIRGSGGTQGLPRSRSCGFSRLSGLGSCCRSPIQTLSLSASRDCSRMSLLGAHAALSWEALRMVPRCLGTALSGDSTAGRSARSPGTASSQRPPQPHCLSPPKPQKSLYLSPFPIFLARTDPERCLREGWGSSISHEFIPEHP